MSDSVRVRIAPSPTGFFHVGTARTALYNYLFARRHGGVFVLRIEDTDRTRSTPESVETILSGLRWLGLEWDEGPGVGGPYGPYRQSERLALYQEHLQRMLQKGRAYECFCTPEELKTRREERQRAKLDPKYDGRCRNLSSEEREALRAEGRPAAIRFKAPHQGTTSWTDLIRAEVSFDNTLLDDFVIGKSDGYPTYNFAVVVDDALMRISHVIRGEDGISNTPRQLLLYRALGYEPPVFAHVPLLLGKDRSKLSKRHGATSLDEFRRQGILPDCMVNFLALLGWSPGGTESPDQELFTRDELVARFDLDEVNKSGAVFDHEKLLWMNGAYLRTLDLDRLVELALPVLAEAGLVQAPVSSTDRERVAAVLGLLRERLRTLTELPHAARYFFTDDFEYEAKGIKKWLSKAETADTLRMLLRALQSTQAFTRAELETAVRQVAESLSVSAAKVIHPCRVAVTGRTAGPGLFELMEVVGREECLRRLERALNFMAGSNAGNPIAMR